MFRPALCVAALVVTLAACSDPAPTPEAGTPGAASLAERYTYTLVSSCGERALLGTFAVTVEDGKVVSAEGLDASGQASAALPSLLEYVPTIDELTARAAAEDPVDVGYDDSGLLTRVTFDPEPQATNDEECYVLGGYAPTA